jgi:hypothetical protein
MRKTQRSAERATGAEQWHQHSFGISGVSFNPCQAHRRHSQQNRPIADVRTESARDLRADCLVYLARLSLKTIGNVYARRSGFQSNLSIGTLSSAPFPHSEACRAKGNHMRTLVQPPAGHAATSAVANCDSNKLSHPTAPLIWTKYSSASRADGSGSIL